MPRIPNDQGLANFLFLKNVEALNKSQPLRFIVGPDSKPPSECMFYMTSGIQQNPPRTCLPKNDSPLQHKGFEFLIISLTQRL